MKKVSYIMSVDGGDLPGCAYVKTREVVPDRIAKIIWSNNVMNYGNNSPIKVISFTEAPHYKGTYINGL